MELPNIDKENPEADLKSKLEALDAGVELDEEEPEEEAGEDELANVLESEPEEEPEQKPVRKNSKEEAAIVALKRENKRQADELKQLKAQQEQALKQQVQDKLKEKYVADGDDEQTATYKAEKDLKYAELEERVMLADFKADNAELLRKYPEAKGALSKIMKDMQATGDTFEQRCRVMFESAEIPMEARAIKAAKGTLESTKNNDNPVSRAARTAEVPQQTVSLTAKDRREKAEFVSYFGEISDADFKKYIDKHRS